MDRPARPPVGSVAAATGVSGGTALVILANALPADSWLRPVLYLLAPSVSVATGWVTAWLLDTASYWRDQRELRQLIREAELAAVEAAADPDNSPQVREAFQRDVANLRRMAANRRLEQARRIRDRGRGG